MGVCSSGLRDPARLRVSAAVVVCRGLNMENTALIGAAWRECTPTISIPIGSKSQWGTGGRVISATQLRQVPKPVQRAGVGQSVHIGNRSSVNDVPDRELGDLAADGPWNVRYRNDL